MTTQTLQLTVPFTEVPSDSLLIRQELFAFRDPNKKEHLGVDFCVSLTLGGKSIVLEKDGIPVKRVSLLDIAQKLLDGGDSNEIEQDKS